MSANSHKNTPLQYIVFFGLVAVITVVFQIFVMPWAIRGYVISFFGPPPSDTSAERVFEEFEGRWVIVEQSKKNEKDKLPKDKYGKEYIFDFSKEDRTDATDGYHKHGSDWILKAKKFGEEEIVLKPLGFSILSFDVGFLLAIFLTMIFPPSIGFIATKIDRVIEETKAKIRLNTGFTPEQVNLLTMPDNELQRAFSENEHHILDMFKKIWHQTSFENGKGAKFESVYDSNESIVFFRDEILYHRIAEYFSEAILTEIQNTKDARGYQRNRLKVTAALRLYMAHHFTEKYANNVTGFAYMGAAILIIIIGVRGLKFIPATEPSLILFAILLEFSLLALLGISLFYTEEEERMDKVLRKLEDAGKKQQIELAGINRNTRALDGAISEDQLRHMIEERLREKDISEEMREALHKVFADALTRGLLAGKRD